MSTPDPNICLSCGYEHTVNGFLCVLCLQMRAHTRHWRWCDPHYLTAIRAEITGTIVQPHIRRARKEAA